MQRPRYGMENIYQSMDDDHCVIAKQFRICEIPMTANKRQVQRLLYVCRSKSFLQNSIAKIIKKQKETIPIKYYYFSNRI